MKEYSVERIRNVVLLSHGGTGKTSLAEAMLYNTGAIKRLGKVDEGTTVSDYDPEEIRRHISVNTSLIPCEWRDHKINILDAPGYADFVGEMKGATRVADGCVIVVDATSGVEVGTELVWKYADERDLPRLVFINKMDRDNANFGRTLNQLREAFEGNFVPLQLPVGAGEGFEGLIDLVTMKTCVGEKNEEREIPPELLEETRSFQQGLVEAAAEAEDELIVKYLEGEKLTAEEIRRGLAAGTRARSVILVLCGSATQVVGSQALLDCIVEYLPSPAEKGVRARSPLSGLEESLEVSPTSPLATLVFKTFADPYVGKLTYFRVYSGVMESDSRVLNAFRNEEERIGQLFHLRGKEQEAVKSISTGDIGAVAKLQATSTGDTLCDKDYPLLLAEIGFPQPVYSAAIKPKTKADLDKMGTALARLVEEDPTLRVSREQDTGETILSGMGESHVEIAARRLERKFGVEIETDVPKVPYKETIRSTANAEGKHKKQTGGRGQYGVVQLRLEPLPRGQGFEFVDKIRGGAIPHNFIPAVEKGLKEAIRTGVLGGYPATDFRAVLYDGKYHPVDSSEIAFKTAASLGFKRAMEQANPVLLEPIMQLAITVPEEFMGDVLGDLNSKRARVLGMDQSGGLSVITAQAPLAEIQRYATDLRSITQGRAYFTMEFDHYEEVPDHIAPEIIARAREEEK
ncbi:MAG: elongation factor G [Anaerolineae bacterium]